MKIKFNPLFKIVIVFFGLFIVSCAKNYAPTISIATIETLDITDLTQISASSGGKILLDGGSMIISSGICWSKNQNPTVNDNKLFENTDSCDFRINMNGLTSNTTYYVMAFAINQVGIAYGNQRIFKTYSGTVTDFDGNICNTVQIGTQVWMVENLKTTHYGNGDIIATTIPADLDISNVKEPKYQWAYEGNEDLVKTYGRLYTWNSVIDSRGIAPIGWRVPGDEDWEKLKNFLSEEGNCGGKLKESGNNHWKEPNIGATDEVSFRALPCGYRKDYGFVRFDYIGLVAVFWSFPPVYDNSHYGWQLDNFHEDFYRQGMSEQNYGLSVRCVKN